MRPGRGAEGLDGLIDAASKRTAGACAPAWNMPIGPTATAPLQIDFTISLYRYDNTVRRGMQEVFLGRQGRQAAAWAHLPRRLVRQTAGDNRIMMPLLVCVAAALVCTGCQYDPYAELLTTRKPRSQDVVGRYKLKEQTVTRGGLSALNGQVSTIELFAGGRFAAVNVPPWQSNPDALFFEGLASGPGTWSIESAGGLDNGFGSEKTAWGVCFESPAAKIRCAGFTGTKPPYGLIFTIGDPDLGEAMLYDRQP